MKLLISAVAVMGSVSANIWADAQGEVCKGASSSGIPITLAVSKDNSMISVSAQGKRIIYDVKETGGGDVWYHYESGNGELKVSFYDQDSSASGWSKETGAFKLNCK